MAEQVFEKWDRRGCWRGVKSGGVWVVPPFGIDRQTGQWTDGYQRRNTDGFSLPANKQNFVALWLLAMHDATKKPVYRERAEKWWRLMKSRMRLRDGGKYSVWNYWDPAGPWDYKPDGSPKHWVGVHPNGGYYAIDVEGIVTAYEHGLVFAKEDLDRLMATNRDFMWNQQVGAPSSSGSMVASPTHDGRTRLECCGRRWCRMTTRCGRCSRRITSRIVGKGLRRRPGILPCVSWRRL